MKIVRAIAMAAVIGGLAGGGCSVETVDAVPDESVLGQGSRDPAITMVRTPQQVTGTLSDNGMEVVFSSTETASGIDVRIELNAMVLTAHYGGSDQILDGVLAQDGTPTLLTEVDQAAIRRLLAGLEAELFPPIDHVTTKEEYDAIRKLTPAEQRLFRVVDAQWSRWPTTMPLRKEFTGDTPRSYKSWRRYASTNTTVTGCHDCLYCSNSGDCCDSGKKLGEYFNGDNYGNCGTSSTGTQFTKDCTNHDQCVRTTKHGGHSLASLWCDDEFTACVDDELAAPSCDYDWRGTSWKGNCPSSWNGTGDGCDCFCQFQDTDC